MHLIQKAIITKGNKYLVLLRSKRASHYPLHWDFPGGKLKPNEEPFAGIAREVKEETTLDIKPVKVFDTYEFDLENTGENTHRFTLYSTKLVSDSVRLSDEHNDFKWALPEEILTLRIQPFLDRFLKDFLDQQE